MRPLSLFVLFFPQPPPLPHTFFGFIGSIGSPLPPGAPPPPPGLQPSEVFISLHEGDEHPLAFSSAVEDAPDLRVTSLSESLPSLQNLISQLVQRWFSYMCTVRMMSGGRKIVSTSSIINTDGWKKSIAMSTKVWSAPTPAPLPLRDDTVRSPFLFKTMCYRVAFSPATLPCRS